MRKYLFGGLALGLIAVAVLMAGMLQGGGTGKGSLSDTYLVRSGDPAMVAAARKAAAGLDDFLAKLDNPPAETGSYAVKVGLLDDGDSFRLTGENETAIVEFFWIVDVTRTAEGFNARISNTPEEIHNVSDGQVIAFTKADIFDWMYMENNKMKGNFSACPALMAASKAERDQFVVEYGIECD